MRQAHVLHAVLHSCALCISSMGSFQALGAARSCCIPVRDPCAQVSFICIKIHNCLRYAS